MKYTTSLATLALIGALGLTACGSSNSKGTGAAPTVEAAAGAVSATPTADGPAKSSRGNILMKVGDPGTVTDTITKKATVNFTVNSIAPVTCTEQYASAPKNGHLYAVDLSIKTTPELAQSSFPKYILTAGSFKFIAANGTTFNGQLFTTAVIGCIPSAEQLPADGLGPGENATGKVLVDLPDTKGVLVMSQSFGPGFEYNF
ncbi:hypothetical protein [Arthrobacter sp. fls2-241-R2A-200]|uniref:hypothetical protein n=1 Tax=Arthrobacter sp. fls2-241-R2A-200 TaxID=3040281 RepID=UPI00254F1E6B|nr:hypothetical protein [Arthrobacter sp. fls2-241-R2A-200]